MSYYRDSPGKRSPYSRSPVKMLDSKRDFIEEQLILKNAYRSEAQNRRLMDQISLLQIRTRKIDELEGRCEALAKQNSLLTLENDQLAKELSERRYQVERIRGSAAQLQERDAFKSLQLDEINRSLEIQIELLKKERIESSKLYESHIQKLEIMLEDKIKQNESLSLKCNDLLNQKQISQIRFEQEKNKLKNLMSRTSYDMQRQLQYTKQKQTTEKFVEMQTMKKNYSSQVALLEDQISKLKATNSYKNTQFEGQLQQNKNLKNRYEQELKNLISENDNLRVRILKLQQMNKTQVETIQEKYSNIHVKGTTSLKEQHQREIRLLLEQIDRQKWIITEKNNQIQHLIREKREIQSAFRDRQLALVTEIQTLKNKLQVQQLEAAKQAHELMNKNNDLHNKNLRDSQNYYERVKNFQSKIKDLQSQIDHKIGQNENLKASLNSRIQQLQASLDETFSNLRKLNQALQDSQSQRQRDNKVYQQYRASSQEQRGRLSEKIAHFEVALQNQKQSTAALKNDIANTDELLRIQIKSLNSTIAVLQKKLSQDQQTHSKQLEQLSSNLRQKIEKLQLTNRKIFEQTKKSHGNEIETLRRRIEKLQREKDDMQKKLQEYIKLYNGLEKYFQHPHKQAVFKEKSSSSIYEALSSVSKSTIHIF